MERDQALADYLSGLTALTELASGDPQRLRQVPAGGGWSAADVLHHLCDADIVSAERLRRILTEDHPELREWDEGWWSGSLAYSARDPLESLAVVRAVREANVGMLSGVPDSAWMRTGQHPRAGSISVEAWLKGQIQHLQDHLDQAFVAYNS